MKSPLRKVIGQVKGLYHAFKFRRRWDFDHKDVWSFDYTLIKYALPRLKWFQLHGCTPGICFTWGFPEWLPGNEEFWYKVARLRWARAIGDIIRGFELHMIDMGEDREWRALTRDENEAVNRAGILFGKYLYCLWT